MTYTFMGLDMDSGQIGYAVTTVSLACGASLASRTEGGAIVISQAFARPDLGSRAVDLINEGKSFDEMNYVLNKEDKFYSYRQLGVLTREGFSFVHTGKDADEWKGHLIGSTYVSMGNLLSGEEVLQAMAGAFEDSVGEQLGERLLRAIEAGRDAGGQAWHGDPLPELSSQVCVYGASRLPALDLRVDFDIDAVGKLRRLYRAFKKVEYGYQLGAEDPPRCLEYLKDTFEELDLYQNQI